MNLNKLYSIQKELDQKIVDKHGLHGQDLLPEKILALQVELAELANEWRGFKFWSENKSPNRVEGKFKTDQGGYKVFSHYEYPLLEEYVDGLHFALSIGLDYGYTKYSGRDSLNYAKEKDLTSQFTLLLRYKLERVNYPHFVSRFLALGEMLGFTEEQIYHAYMDKNKVNHTRQESGY
jgi:dimeric dUTPase (all-alpha-NTP-PPase superfamily)